MVKSVTSRRVRQVTRKIDWVLSWIHVLLWFSAMSFAVDILGCVLWGKIIVKILRLKKCDQSYRLQNIANHCFYISSFARLIVKQDTAKKFTEGFSHTFTHFPLTHTHTESLFNEFESRGGLLSMKWKQKAAPWSYLTINLTIVP